MWSSSSTYISAVRSTLIISSTSCGSSDTCTIPGNNHHTSAVTAFSHEDAAHSLCAHELLLKCDFPTNARGSVVLCDTFLFGKTKFSINMPPLCLNASSSACFFAASSTSFGDSSTAAASSGTGMPSVCKDDSSAMPYLGGGAIVIERKIIK